MIIFVEVYMVSVRVMLLTKWQGLRVDHLHYRNGLYNVHQKWLASSKVC